MSFCYRMWGFLAVEYAVTVLQLRHSHAAASQPIPLLLPTVISAGAAT
jgi:hypothetical protein